MARLRDKRNGVVVQVDEAFAAQLGSAYERLDEAPAAPKVDEPAVKRAPRKATAE